MSLASATRTLAIAGMLAAAFGGARAFGQSRDSFGAPIAEDPPRAEQGEIRQTVARVSNLAGPVSYARGDDPDNWQAAEPNLPLTIGDRLFADDRGRVELQVHGGDYVRLGSRTDFAVLNLTDDTRQFAVKSGVASFRVRRLDENAIFEVDTPNAAVTLERPGDYRIDIDADGGTRVLVRDGAASVAAGGGAIALGTGDAIRIEGIDAPRYDFVAAPPPDGWDRWVAEREARIAQTRSYQYVSADIVGVDDLDEHGRWESVPGYGFAWTPTVVPAGWLPYRAGQWIWQDPWGWTWVSTESWGWAPYHYGRWVSYGRRWYWVPVAHAVPVVAYSPALVAFVGGGPGWSASFQVAGGGFVGWFPLAPRDPLIPWWGPHVSVRAAKVTYVNRTYVTVVNRNVFVSGGLVANHYVRDRMVLREVSTAPVVRGVLPVAPTRESLGFAARPGAAAASRPPAAIVARPVMARVAPPPAPPSFQQKLPVIRENRGAPLAPVSAAEISVKDRGRPQAITAVRPVASESGRMTLAPRGEAPASAKARPEPVAPVRGRSLATVDRPVASAPVAAPVGSSAARPPAPPTAEGRGIEDREVHTPAAASHGRRVTAAPVVGRPTPARATVGSPTVHERESVERHVPARPTAAPVDVGSRPPVTAVHDSRSGRSRESAAPPTHGAPVRPTPVTAPRVVPQHSHDRPPAAPTSHPKREAPTARPTPKSKAD